MIIQGCKHEATKELFSHSGQLLLRTKENELDLSRFAKGIYILRCEGQVRKVVVE
ncbi:MAG: T9SS type A sorting domain-containing protein [Bacteroidetes bacterium]|nr:T9SS type A sorting domain-containing protein [Bacteroidota bacterium]